MRISSMLFLRTETSFAVSKNNYKNTKGRCYICLFLMQIKDMINAIGMVI